MTIETPAEKITLPGIILTMIRVMITEMRMILTIAIEIPVIPVMNEETGIKNWVPYCWCVETKNPVREFGTGFFMFKV
jgi:hypothetical protein